MNREHVDSKGLNMNVLVDIDSRLRFDSGNLVKNKLVMDFTNSSSLGNNDWAVDNKCDSEPICLVNRSDKNISENFKQENFKSDVMDNQYSRRNGEVFQSEKYRKWKLSNCTDMNMQGFSSSVGNQFHVNNSKFTSDKYLRRVRPDMTASLSWRSDSREGRSGHCPQEVLYQPYTFNKYDGMMAAEEDSAINLTSEGRHGPDGIRRAFSLSPESKPHLDGLSVSHSLGGSPAGFMNGETDLVLQDRKSPREEERPSTAPSAGLLKRKSRSADDKPTDSLDSPGGLNQHQSLLLMAAQQGLTPQQLQQMIMAHQGATTPPNLQQLLQAQQSIVMHHQQKAQEQALLQLNEQLQLNLLQQSQLVQEKKTNGKQTQQQLQQLGIQQQQIVQQIQQIQLQQRQLLLACLMQPYSSQQGMMTPADLHQAWKELSSSQGNSDDSVKSPAPNGTSLGSLNGLGVNPLLQGSLLGLNGVSHDSFPLGALGLKAEEGFSPLYKRGQCQWPGCEKVFSDLTAFAEHLCSVHTLDDKNTAQARVQMQIVSQLEMQLSREKELLHAMMQHLHTLPQRKSQDEKQENKVSEKNMTSPKLQSRVISPNNPVSSGNNPLPVHPQKKPHISLASSGLSPLVIPPQPTLTSVSSAPGSLHSHSQPSTPTSAGLGPMRRRVSDKCNLPISAEIQRNRDFYKTTDVRPPFTYASLIRQAIIESENKQLTLNEVYQWFQNTFAYFRRNEATWKNAVRHNLSLHKCFMRVENVKGAVWTVDEVEFYKRRPQKLTGAIPSSPSFSPDGGIYGDPINASVRAAIEQNSLLCSQHLNGATYDGAEDLSVKSHNNSNDSFIKSESPQRDDMYLRPEAFMYQDSVNNSPRDLSSQGLDLSPKSSQQNSPKGLAVPGPSRSQGSSPQPRKPRGVEFEIGEVSGTRYVENSGENMYMCKQEETSDEEEMEREDGQMDMQMSSDMDQSEALNMTMESREKSATSKENGQNDLKNGSDMYRSGDSPQFLRKSPAEQPLHDKNINPTYHHSNNMVAVSHSMT